MRDRSFGQREEWAPRHVFPHSVIVQRREDCLSDTQAMRRNGGASSGTARSGTPGIYPMQKNNVVVGHRTKINQFSGLAGEPGHDMMGDAHEITNTGERHPNGERAMADHPLRAVALELNEPMRL